MPESETLNYFREYLQKS